MNCAGREPAVKGAAVAARVDDRQSLRSTGDFAGDIVPASPISSRRQRDIDPIERSKKRRRVGGDLYGREAVEHFAEGRLGRGAQNDRASVVLDQLVEDGCDRPQDAGRQRLRFVEDQHAGGEIVDLAQLRSAVREQGFEQLHGRGDDQRRVPVLARKPGTRGLLLRTRAERAVMLEHRVGADGLPEDAGGLLDDAGERDRIYDPA